jgi:hypothetical protein
VIIVYYSLEACLTDDNTNDTVPGTDAIKSLAQFPHFINNSGLMRSPCCPSVCPFVYIAPTVSGVLSD